MRRKLAAAILAVLVATVWSSQSFAGTSLSEAKKQVEELKDKLGDIKDSKNQAKDQLITNQNRRAEIVRNLEAKGYAKEQIEAKIDQIRSAIDSLNDAIDIAQKDLDEELTLFRERMVVLYMRSKTMYELDELMSSDNFSTLFKKINTMKLVSEVDQELMASIEKKQEELADLVSSKEAEERKSEAEVEALIKEMDNLSVSRAEAEEDISETKQTLAEIEAEEKAVQAESRQMEALVKKLQSSTAAYVGGDMLWPVPSRHTIGSGFGYRIHPIYGYKKMHNGIDIGGDYNLDIIAANDGKVIVTSYSKTSGNMIVIDHGGGISTFYLHLNNRGILVKEGQEVKAGQVIGKMGSTGLSTGPHLHFEYRKNGVPQDPVPHFGTKVGK